MNKTPIQPAQMASGLITRSLSESPRRPARTQRTKPIAYSLRIRVLTAVALTTVGLTSMVAAADTVNAIYKSATDVPVPANGYKATGNTVTFAVNFAPGKFQFTDPQATNNPQRFYRVRSP
jgi:hypothetical protein